MKKFKSRLIVPLHFMFVVFFFLFFVCSSYAATYYHKYKAGVPVYTNIPPVEMGFKRIVIKHEAYDVKRNFFGKFSYSYSKNYDDHINKTAKWFGIDPYLVKAVIKVESNFNAKAVSPKGAIGVMQLMPGTARDQGVNNPYDPTENIHGGVRYLRKLMDMFNGDLRLALAGYNAGENAVIKYGYTIPPYNETENYVDKVLTHYNYLKNKLFEEADKETARTGVSKIRKEPSVKKTSAKNVAISEGVSPDKMLIVETKKTKELTKADSSPVSKAGSGRRFTVQLASFPDLGEAREMELILKSKSYPAFIQKAEVPGKGTRYRVRVGAFDTIQEAQLYGDTIKNVDQRIGAVLVTFNK